MAPGSARPLMVSPIINPNLALIAEVQQKVTEQLQMLQLTYVQQYMMLLQKHEEQQNEISRLFQLLITEAEEAEQQGRAPSLDALKAPMEALVPWREPSGLENIGRELQKLHNHVSCELGRISQDVVRERVARARDNEPGKSNWARDSYVRRQTSKEPPHPAAQMPPALTDVPSPKLDRRQEGRNAPASSSQARKEPRSPGKGDGITSGTSLSGRSGLSAREEACKTPLEHLKGVFGGGR
mmetsp:Transcript_43109/g.127768  ORF Transcript_43109/g.127768 Transcript_43109/m.127768 type:complete len:240 (-) Transcript_43109:347-1066(-)